MTRRAPVDGQENGVPQEQPWVERSTLALLETPSEDEEHADRSPHGVTESLHQLVAAQVARTPEAVAVVQGRRRWSYSELDRRARQLAGRLRSVGVRAGDRVAVCVSPSPELLAGLLAVLYTGAAYVPISRRTPAERAGMVIADVRARCVLTDATLPVGTWSVDCPVVDLGETVPAPCTEEEAPDPAPVHPESLAYVIYTSGSTGAPKGVMVPHRAVCNTLRWRQSTFPMDASDRMLVTFDYVFDASVFELFQPLLGGAAVVFPDEDMAGDPDRIIRQVRRNDITILGVVPTWLALLVESPELSECSALRLIFSGGEALAQRVADALHGRTRALVCNMYGPTEAAIEATYAVCRRGEQVSLGRPIDGVGVRVLGEGLRPCPPGTVGELFISGAGLARGYAGDPALTASRFLPDPFASAPGSRMYATGDLGRYSTAGRLDYVGRRDLQVKVNGQRIELEEIESALESAPDVVEAAVTIREDPGGGRQLVGFMVPRPDRSAGLEERTREHLRKLLPAYLTPSVLRVLPQLPRTATGKKDRRSLMLPPPDRSPAGAVPAEPVTDLLLGIWRSVLDRPDLGVRDDLFVEGGTSIQAAIVAHRMEDVLGEYVYAVAVYDAPTVERMAAYLRQNYPVAVSRLTGATAPAGHWKSPPLSSRDLDRLRLCVRTLPDRPGPPPGRRNPPAVFVLSPPRSGTTLLRTMLAGHPQLFAPPELQLLNFPTLRDRHRVLSNRRDDFWLQGTVRALMALHGVEADVAMAIMDRCERANLTVQQFYRRVQALLDGRMLVDKTPTYALDPAALRRAEEYFDEPRYIHLIRDAGAAIESFLEAKLHVFFPPFFTRPPEMDPRTLAEAIWDVSHENITAFLERVDPGRALTVYFDDLVKEPAGTMRRISEFLGIPFQPETVNPYGKDPRVLMTDPVHPLARMLGDVKFQQHGRVRRERADRGGDRPGGVELGAPTSRLQARLSARTARRPSSLVTLRAEGEVPALFLVHPAGGGVDCYQHLIARLWPGPQVHAHHGVSAASPHGSLVELAAAYVNDLRERQPHGPYRLCGWSFGGVVAFEMATQLIAGGEDVAFLALLDTRLHLRAAPPILGTDDDAVDLFLRDHELDRGGQPGSSRSARALAEARRRGIVPPSLSLEEFVDMAIHYGVAFRDNVALARAYSPTGRVPRVVVVEASDGHHGRTTPASSWTPWADHVVRERVSGDHFSMLRPPHVDAVARIVAGHLLCQRSAEKGQGPGSATTESLTTETLANGEL